MKKIINVDIENANKRIDVFLSKIEVLSHSNQNSNIRIIIWKTHTRFSCMSSNI